MVLLLRTAMLFVFVPKRVLTEQMLADLRACAASGGVEGAAP